MNFIPTQPRIENFEKNSKKIKISKNLILVLFLSKLGCDRPRKRKKKSVPNSFSNRYRQENSQKNSKNFQKIKKRHSGNIPLQTGLRKIEINFFSKFHSNRTRAREFSKNSKNFQKINNIILALFLSKQG